MTTTTVDCGSGDVTNDDGFNALFSGWLFLKDENLPQNGYGKTSFANFNVDVTVCRLTKDEAKIVSFRVRRFTLDVFVWCL